MCVYIVCVCTLCACVCVYDQKCLLKRYRLTMITTYVFCKAESCLNNSDDTSDSMLICQLEMCVIIMDFPELYIRYTLQGTTVVSCRQHPNLKLYSILAR